MIYITGDTHRDIDWHKLTSKSFPQKHLTKDDFVIVLGDFGAVWDGCYTDEKTDSYFLSWYQNKPWTTLFIDGNHENHEALATYPEQEWNGGKVHVLRPSVLHLERGQVFTINGLKFFTMGGAKSTDKHLRKPHVSWWKEELPSIDQIEQAETALSENNWSVDYILTHTCPSHVLQTIYGWYNAHPCDVERWFDEIYLKASFRHWYFGHHHLDTQIKYNITAVYNNIIPLPEKETAT